MRIRLYSFKPILPKRPKILILGSMPGPEALRKKEYYGFNGNHFWRIMADLFKKQGFRSYSEKQKLLKDKGIILWDVIASCHRKGAGDSAIKNITPNPIIELLSKYSGVRAIFLNGKTAERLFLKYFGKTPARPLRYLPSTSPAYASLSYEDKLKKWSAIKKVIDG